MQSAMSLIRRREVAAGCADLSSPTADSNRSMLRYAALDADFADLFEVKDDLPRPASLPATPQR
jgi:hypothetical protein